ncbi:MAG: hypothetical protein MUP03_03595, partial [Anaerolineales bacterium]|nr:hypothetical protein [Anaerolineales bacterium]
AEILSRSLQVVAYGLPLTRGIAAARLAMAGAGWSTISSLVWGELLTGLVYVCIGYMLLTWFEKLSLVDGKIEAI